MPVINAVSQVVTSQPMMQIQWKDGVRVHIGCGGEVEVIGEGYICTGCGEQSFSDVLSEEEQERERAEEDEQAREAEREEFHAQERKQFGDGG